jgi:hypothetical protein
MQISPDLFACTLSDANMLRIMSRSERRVVADVDLAQFGASAMFVHADVIPDDAFTVLASCSGDRFLDAAAEFGPDIFPVPALWFCTGVISRTVVDNCSHWRSEGGLSTEYIAHTAFQKLTPGRYRLKGAGRCASGGISVGLEDAVTHRFVAVIPLSGSATVNEVFFEIENEINARLVLSAFNLVSGPLDAVIECISLRSTHSMPPLELSANLAPEGEWECVGLARFRRKYKQKAAFQLDIDVPVGFEYLFLAPPQTLVPGSYRVEFGAECATGGLALSVLDVTNTKILANAVCHPGTGEGIEPFCVNHPIQARLVLCGGNDVAGPIKAEVRHVALRKMNEGNA